MPYLPTAVINNTVFPQAWDKDIFTQARLQMELYERTYPPIPYYCIKVAATAASPSGDLLSGETGSTKFDPLYREAVDSSLTDVAQPHLSNTQVTANPEVFDPPILVNLRVQRISRENQRKKEGHNRLRTITAFCPTALLDKHGITCQPGDYFVWDDKPYTVVQADTDGYWKNTNIRMFIKLTVESKTLGS